MLSALERNTCRGGIRPQSETPSRLLGCRSLGAWPRSCWGAAWGGERFFTPALGRGVLSAGPAPGPSGVTRPGPRAGGAKGAPKGGLISFPRAAEVSAKCLSHLFKFYGAWLVADGPRPGEEAGAGSGSLPRLRGSSSRQGADQARGTRACGVPSLRPPSGFPGPSCKGFGLLGPRGRGLPLSFRPGPAPIPGFFTGHTSLVLLPASFGMCIGVTGASGRGSKRSRNGYQPWCPS